MTYCVGMLAREGLVMMADTRTNAGVDNISTYRKLHMLADDDQRIVVLASAGNLSVSQSVLGLLAEGLPPEHEGEPPRRVCDMPSMFRAAQLVGEAVRRVSDELLPSLSAANVDARISLLLGGRIGDGPIQLYLIYAAGNFIECQPDCPFLQIGATQYGKPILDRALTYEIGLDEAVKVGLISFDSTMRSNLSVGRPLDLIVIPADRGRPVTRRRIEVDDSYFNDLSARWSMLLNESRATIPDPPFMMDSGR
jgi:putative proteasome-type protease